MTLESLTIGGELVLVPLDQATGPRHVRAFRQSLHSISSEEQWTQGERFYAVLARPPIVAHGCRHSLIDRSGHSSNRRFHHGESLRAKGLLRVRRRY